MKKFTNLAVLLLFTFQFAFFTSYSQSPKKFKYQTVVRNSTGAIVKNQAVAFKISILQGSATTGTAAYSETQSKTTNDFGLVNLEIGSGINVSGSMNTINWANGPYFVKVELDINNGTTFITMGTSELLSVPYALYAEKAGTTTYTETDPIFAAHPSHGITATNITNWTNAFGWGNHVGLYRPIGYVPAWSEITGKPNFSTIATSGSYNDLLNKPILWDSSWASIKNKPAFFDGSWANLTGKPSFATVATSGSYNDLLNKPTLFSGAYSDLTGKPVLWDSSWVSIKNKPVLDGSETKLTAGTNVSITGIGTTANPYILNATGGGGTSLLPPTATTQAATNIKSFSATFNGIVNANNLLTSVQFEFDTSICYCSYYRGYSTTITVTGNSNVTVIDSLSSYLNPGKTYYYRIRASNAVNTTLGNNMSFTTIAEAKLTTAIIDSIKTTSAISGGTITSDGGSPITVRGVCWSNGYYTTPTIADNHTSNGSGTGTFTSHITGLTANTTYSVRAYATNTNGTYYGNSNYFYTPSGAPSMQTNYYFDSITCTSAISGGEILDDGGSPITVRGVCWDTIIDPTITGNHTNNGSGIGVFTSKLTGLTMGKYYYVRAYATNSTGTFYGNQRTLYTSNGTINLETNWNFDSVTCTSAVSGGNIYDDGGCFTVLSRGLCWDTISNPTITNNHTTAGSGSGSFISKITGLKANTTYYVRAYATNSTGTYYGYQQTLSTSNGAPSIQTNYNFDSVTCTSAVGGGTINNSGGCFPVLSSGICWDTISNPTITDNHTSNGSGTGSFTSKMTGLKANTYYYVRAYATNVNGTYYGYQEAFNTPTGIISNYIYLNYVNNITSTTAKVTYRISNDGGSPVIARGVCWDTVQTPTITDNHTNDGDGIGTGNYLTSNITGLTMGTTYYVRAYATNAYGTFYSSNEENFNTMGIPKISGVTISNIKGNSAQGQIGSILDGGSGISETGICWNTSPNPTIANFNAPGIYPTMTSLSPNTIYYVRAYATNPLGTGYSPEISFNSGYLMGATNAGGLVFYNDGNGHGMVCAPSDQSTGIQWHNGSYFETNAIATAVGTGKANTDTIIAKQGNGNYAAKTCRNLSLSGFNDWYLPSRDEMNFIRDNLNSLGGFIQASYWTSSEFDGNLSWQFTFDSGYGYYSYNNKNTLNRVRAVRNF